MLLRSSSTPPGSQIGRKSSQMEALAVGIVRWGGGRQALCSARRFWTIRSVLHLYKQLFMLYEHLHANMMCSFQIFDAILITFDERDVNICFNRIIVRHYAAVSWPPKAAGEGGVGWIPRVGRGLGGESASTRFDPLLPPPLPPSPRPLSRPRGPGPASMPRRGRGGQAPALGMDVVGG